MIKSSFLGVLISAGSSLESFSKRELKDYE